MKLDIPRWREPTAVVKPGTPTFGVKTFDRPGPELAALWDACLTTAAGSSRFCTHGWYQAWLSTYGSQPPWTGSSRVLALTDGAGRSVGILPLIIGRKYGFRILSLAGYYQPIRTLVADWSIADRVGAAMAEAVLGSPLAWEVLRLGPIDLSAPGHRAFVEALQAMSPFTRVDPINRNIVCHNLPASFDEYKASCLSPKFEREIRYYQRRARRVGKMAIRHDTNPTGERLVSLLSDCGLIEASSWLAEANQARPRFRTDLDLRFWDSVVRDCRDRGHRLDVWVMDFAGRPISFCVTMTAEAVRYIIANQYDAGYRKYSTGSILYYHVMEDACRTGVRSVDFGEGDLHYKGRWGGIEAGERAYIVSFPPGLKGAVVATGYRLATQVKRRGWPSAMAQIFL